MTGSGSIWYALVAIIMLATVYEYSPRWGGILLLLLVFGMLLIAQRRGVLASAISSISSG